VIRTTIRQVVSQRKRLTAVTLAIAISVAFLTATLLFGPVLNQSFRNRVGAEYRHVDLIVQAGDRPLDAAAISRLRAIEGVAGVEPRAVSYMEAHGRGSSVYLIGANVPTTPSVVEAQEMIAGRLPAKPGEIAVSAWAATQLRVESGETTSFQVPSETVSATPETREFTVTGIYGDRGRFGDDDVAVYMMPDDLAIWNVTAGYPKAFVIANPDVLPEQLQQAVIDVVGSGATVTTADQQIDIEVEEFRTATRIQALAIVAFAVVALVVAGVVISNTFTILVAQRTRDLALYRCVGATASQVRRLVLTEALVIGVVGAAIGVTVSIVGIEVLLRVLSRQERFDIVPASADIGPGTVILPLVAGVLLAAGAAWSPSREATRVSPLQALRTLLAPPISRRPGKLRVLATILLVGGGGSLLLLGMLTSMSGSREMGVLIGLAGGTIAFLGVLTGAVFVVPPAIRILGAIAARLGGVPARISAANSVRNPRRTTATTVALLIGVTLVTMMSVGAATLRATFTQEIEATTPIDLEVLLVTGGNGEGAALQPAFASAADAIEGVGAVTGVSRVLVDIQSPDGVMLPDMIVQGIDPAGGNAVSRDPDLLAPLGPGTIIAPDYFGAEGYGWTDGSDVTLSVNGTSLSLDARLASFEGDAIVALSDLDRLAPSSPLTGLWIRLEDDADANVVMDRIYDIADQQGVRVSIGGGSTYRATLLNALDILLYVVTGLLAVAIVIAIVGVGNTLSLSMIERTRESALLRTLGFTRRQLRLMVAVEGVLIAGIGGLLGMVIGTIFGWIGALTLIGDAWAVALRVPIGWLIATIAIAILTGLLASVLPARRAVREDPIVALAET
jgi:putative ABC transport system permease protein